MSPPKLPIPELMDLLEAGKLPFKEDFPKQLVMYHDPCDLGRKSGIFEAPRLIFRAIFNQELKLCLLTNSASAPSLPLPVTRV